MSHPLLTAVSREFDEITGDRTGVPAMLAAEIGLSGQKLIVLDDDPTGVQTIHDLVVFTDWTLDSIRQGFARPERMFFILTNSRGMTEAQTRAAHQEIARNIIQVSQECQTGFMLISRCDSTLRGHYPLETAVLRETLETAGHSKIDAEILVPFFKEGGRFTVSDIHYVNETGTLVPAAETEFARDKTFGYEHSDLKDYIEEKTGGLYRADSVTSVDLDALRRLDIAGITSRLLATRDFGKVVVNALDELDIAVFCVAMYRAMAQGKTFLLRTAASFVKVAAGIQDKPLLTRQEMIRAEGPVNGIIVIGSHTAKTTEQLEALKQIEDLAFVEFDSDLVLDNQLTDEVLRVTGQCDKILRDGRTAVVYTRRTLLDLPDDTPEKALVRSAEISDAFQSVVGSLQVSPEFVIAKGGITSSDVAIKALKVRQACVLGQIQPGVPVWRTGPESRFPGIPYVIFPGNVGARDSLLAAVKILLARE